MSHNETHPPLTTRVHVFNFDLTDSEQKKAWKALEARLSETHGHIMHSLSVGERDHYSTGKLLERETLILETEHLFSNQWNTKPISGISDKGFRVFDFARDALFGPSGSRVPIARGYYLDVTPEMREIRRNTLKCGYCGAQRPAASGETFHLDCLESEYLKPADLKLLRLRPVCERAERPELTEAERARLEPLYTEAQIHGRTERGRNRTQAKRRKILESASRKIETAETERDGLLWLMDKGISLDNVIFYSHTGRFCFGWRSPVSEDIKNRLLDIISEFRFPYDIKTAEGRTLSGN